MIKKESTWLMPDAEDDAEADTDTPRPVDWTFDWEALDSGTMPILLFRL